MPPLKQVVSSPLSYSWLVSRDDITSISNLNADDTSLVQEAFDISTFISQFKLVSIGILAGLGICGLVIWFMQNQSAVALWFRYQLGVRPCNIEEIRYLRSHLRGSNRRKLSHHIERSEGVERQVPGMEVERETDAEIDWEIRPDPLYISAEERQAKCLAQRVADRSKQNTPKSPRKKLLEPTLPVIPEFPLIQSGNSRSERIPIKPAQFPERAQKEVSKASRPQQSRKVTTSSKAYPLEDNLNGWGYFNTNGYIDETGEPHIWQSRRSGESMASYETIMQSRTPIVKYHPYPDQRSLSQLGEWSQTSSMKSVRGMAMADSHTPSMRSQVSSKNSYEKQPTAPSGMASSKENLSAQSQLLPKSATKVQPTKKPFYIAVHSQFPKIPLPSKIPTPRGSLLHQMPRNASYAKTPTQTKAADIVNHAGPKLSTRPRVPTGIINNAGPKSPIRPRAPTGSVSPVKPKSPTTPTAITGVKSPVTAIKVQRSGRAPPTETSPLLNYGYRSSKGGKSSDSVKTVIEYKGVDK